MMTVAGPGGEPDTISGPDGFATRVRHEHDLALDHVDELILLRMRVPGRRLAAGQNSYEVDAVVPEPRMIAQASVENVCAVPRGTAQDSSTRCSLARRSV
jgi:hypothetical protein